MTLSLTFESMFNDGDLEIGEVLESFFARGDGTIGIFLLVCDGERSVPILNLRASTTYHCHHLPSDPND
jgi:hypothetical protein